MALQHHHGMRWVFPILVTLAILALLALLGVWAGVVGVRYPVVVADEPFSPLDDSEVIASRTDGILVLKSGKAVRLSEEIAKLIKHEAWNRVFLKEGDSIQLVDMAEGAVMVMARKREVICGMSWAQPIAIPLIPQRVYRNRVVAVGWGELVTVAK